MSTWVKDNAEFTFKLGIVDGKVITVEEIQSLATLPGKEELFSKLLFLIQSPAQRLATVINATGRNLAVVVNMAAEQGKFGGPAAVAAPVEEAKTEAPVAEARCQRLLLRKRLPRRLPSRLQRRMSRSRRPVSSLRARLSRRTGRHRRLVKLLRRNRRKGNPSFVATLYGCAVWAQRKPEEMRQPEAEDSHGRTKSVGTEI